MGNDKPEEKTKAQQFAEFAEDVARGFSKIAVVLTEAAIFVADEHNMKNLQTVAFAVGKVVGTVSGSLEAGYVAGKRAS